LQRHQSRVATGDDGIRCKRDQFGCVSAKALRIAQTLAVVDAHIAPIGPAQLLQSLCDGRYSSLAFRIVWGQGAQEKADAPHPRHYR
jgi:hypothetical protein